MTFGKRDLYIEVFFTDKTEKEKIIKEVSREERYFIVGNYNGDYAVAVGEEKGDCIYFINRDVKIISIRDVKNFQSKLYRKSVLEEKWD